MTARMPRVSGTDVLAALQRGGWSVVDVDIDGSHHQLEHPDHSGRVTVPVPGNTTLNLKTLRSILRQANMTMDDLRKLLSEAAMHYTVLLSPESDPPGYVAYVQVLGVVTQGETIEAALQAAGEAARLEIRGRIRHDEDVPTEPVDCVLTKIEVEVPVAAAVS